MEEISKALISDSQPLIIQNIIKELQAQIKCHINEKEILERYRKLMKYGKYIIGKYACSRQYPYAIKDTNRNVYY